MNNYRSELKKRSKIVIKIGSSVITTKGGLDKKRINHLCNDISWLHKLGKQIIIVSSGAVSAGTEALLKNSINKKNIRVKQALAAIGQGDLIHSYKEGMNRAGINIGQILLTHADLANSYRQENIKNTIEALLKFRAIPIINENDTVSTEELTLGDNDQLSGALANLIKADLTILLSDVDGLYDGHPREKTSKQILTVDKINKKVESFAQKIKSKIGTGGMVSKLKAAKMIASKGGQSIIANGHQDSIIRDIINGKEVGTLFI